MGERTEGIAVALEAEQGGVVVVALREFGGFGLVRGTGRGGAFAILRTLRIVGTRPSALQARLGEQQRKRLTERCASRPWWRPPSSRRIAKGMRLPASST